MNLGKKHFTEYRLIALLGTVGGMLIAASLPVNAAEWTEASTPIDQTALLAQSEGQPSISGAFEFSIQMPDSPAIPTQRTNLAGQNLNWNVLRSNQGEEVFVLAYTDLSPGDVSADGSEIVTSMAENLLSEIDLDVLQNSDRDITLGIHPGRETLGIINGNIVAGRLYLVGERLYALFARTADIQTANRFFDSFRARPTWETLISEEGKFSVQIPVVATSETYTSEIDGIPLTWTAIRADDSVDTNPFKAEGSPESLYVIAYTDLPTYFLQQEKTELLDKFSNGLLQRLSLTDELGNSSRPVALAGYPGVELVGLATERIVSARLYLVEERIFVLFTMSDTMTEISHFFDSFELQ